VTAVLFSLAILAVNCDDPDTSSPLVDSSQQADAPSDVSDNEDPRFVEKQTATVKEADPWLKDVPWFLPPPPEWGPLPPQMYMSYWHKPYAPPLSTPNYYPLYSKESEFLPLAPQYPSNYPWTPGSFKGSSSPLLAVGPSVRVSPYLAYMRGGRSGRTPPPGLLEEDSHVYRTKHTKTDKLKQRRKNKVEVGEELVVEKRQMQKKKAHTTHKAHTQHLHKLKKQTHGAQHLRTHHHAKHQTHQQSKHHQTENQQVKHENKQQMKIHEKQTKHENQMKKTHENQQTKHENTQQMKTVAKQQAKHHKDTAKDKAKIRIQHKRNKSKSSHKMSIDELVDHYAHLEDPKVSPFVGISSSLTTFSHSAS